MLFILHLDPVDGDQAASSNCEISQSWAGCQGWPALNDKDWKGPSDPKSLQPKIAVLSRDTQISFS